MAMDAAVKATGGKVSDKEALTKAIAKAQFPSVRGNFRYANNHFPVQNFTCAASAKRRRPRDQQDHPHRARELRRRVRRAVQAEVSRALT